MCVRRSRSRDLRVSIAHSSSRELAESRPACADGVLPGYGIAMQNGFQDTFTATATAALEVGAMAYARGLIDHQWNNFVRYDGMINYRAEEVAQSGRMLTMLALYHSYSRDTPLLLQHFDKARVGPRCSR